MVLFGVFALNGASSSAQSWCPPGGARWNFNLMGLGMASGQVYQYDADTLIDGIPSQHLSIVQTTTQLGNNDTLIVGHWETFTRHDENVVLMLDQLNAVWDTLYWFGAQPGDTWWQFGATEDGERYVVLDTGFIVVEGVQLRALTVQTMCGTDPFGERTLIERVGWAEGALSYNCSTADNYNFSTYCDTALSYPIPGWECDFTTSLEPSQRIVALEAAFPNPASGTLYISLRTTDPQKGELRLIDAAGREAMRFAVGAFGEEIVLDVRGQVPGAYVLQFISANRIMAISHVVIER
ncbi:MAG TPA: T9SS type A sorting domain-containing protein [Flavobacteriales bacterium]|nr:T9SS type A sorting domain-containing protein [Flavobacteriales bacterium]